MKIFAIVVLAICFIGQTSNRPAPTPTETSNKQQNHNQSSDNRRTGGNAPTSATPAAPTQLISPQRDLKPTNVSNESNCKSSANWWLVFFTAALVLASILQFLALRRQANSLADSVKTANDAAKSAKESAEAATNTVKSMDVTAERELRAYVFTVRVERHKRTPFGADPFMVAITITNGGKTPAYNCCPYARISCIALNQDIGLPEPVRSETDPMFVLHPGQTFEFSTDPTPMPDGQHKIVMNGIQDIHVWGKIDYIDTFGEPRYTRFHLKCSGAINYSDGVFVYCKHGNKAH
jgi:hypothetical protein